MPGVLVLPPAVSMAVAIDDLSMIAGATELTSGSTGSFTSRSAETRVGDMPIVASAELPEPNEVTSAEGRLTTRTYASRSSAMQFGRERMRSLRPASPAGAGWGNRPARAGGPDGSSRACVRSVDRREEGVVQLLHLLQSGAPQGGGQEADVGLVRIAGRVRLQRQQMGQRCPLHGPVGRVEHRHGGIVGSARQVPAGSLVQPAAGTRLPPAVRRPRLRWCCRSGCPRPGCCRAPPGRRAACQAELTTRPAPRRGGAQR